MCFYYTRGTGPGQPQPAERRTACEEAAISSLHSEKRGAVGASFSHHLSLSMSRLKMVPVTASISKSYSVQPLRISTSYSARPSSQSNWHLTTVEPLGHSARAICLARSAVI